MCPRLFWQAQRPRQQRLLTRSHALAALEKDHDFLLKGDVFTQDVIETWVEYKRTQEIDELRLRPHPYEFALYYDA